jgi:hypothetical protein
MFQRTSEISYRKIYNSVPRKENNEHIIKHRLCGIHLHKGDNAFPGCHPRWACLRLDTRRAGPSNSEAFMQSVTTAGSTPSTGASPASHHYTSAHTHPTQALKCSKCMFCPNAIRNFELIQDIPLNLGPLGVSKLISSMSFPSFN